MQKDGDISARVATLRDTGVKQSAVGDVENQQGKFLGNGN